MQSRYGINENRQADVVRALFDNGHTRDVQRHLTVRVAISYWNWDFGAEGRGPFLTLHDCYNKKRHIMTASRGNVLFVIMPFQQSHVEHVLNVVPPDHVLQWSALARDYKKFLICNAVPDVVQSDCCISQTRVLNCLFGLGCSMKH